MNEFLKRFGQSRIDSITTKQNLSGTLTVSGILGTTYVHKQYIGYSKREAIRLFKKDQL